MSITLSDEQTNAINVVYEKFKKIYNGEITDKFVSLAGFAGTGKTTCMPFLAKKIHEEGLSIHWCCPTGKASSILRKKLNANKEISKYEFSCSTIHSLIYVPNIDKNGKIIGWRLRPTLEYDVIIIDEASMVSKELFKDLCEFRLPIIAVGDSGQLPAIGESISLVNNADYTLQTIHRQALDSPIISLSMQVRKTGEIRRGSIGKGVSKVSKIFDKSANKMVDIFVKNYAIREDSMIICGMHKTRVHLNNMSRLANTFVGKMPNVGEKIICLKNCPEYKIFNGTIGYIEEIIEDLQFVMKLKIKIDNGDIITVPVWKLMFGAKSYADLEQYLENKEYTKEVDDKDYFNSDDKLTLWDFGYSITCHKSQGSEWENVLVIEERNQYQSDEDFKRWLYTAITRSSKRLGIIEDF